MKLLDGLNPRIAELTQAIDQEVEKSAEARRLMTQPGVGPLTALAFVLIIRKAERFQCGKQNRGVFRVSALRGFQWRPASAGTYHQARQLAVALLAGGVGAGSGAKIARRSQYFHLAMRRGRKIAKVAVARKLAIRLFRMMRQGWEYEQMKQFSSHAGQLGHRDGVQQSIE